MMRWLAVLVAGIVLGGIVHLVSVLALPRIASQDAYSRLIPLAPVNTMTQLPPATPETTLMPFMDPAFATAVCRYDLGEGPLKLRVPVSPSYTSVSFYTADAVAYYAINDRSAGRKTIELDLMTEAQHAALPKDEDVTAADRLIIDSPSQSGLIVVRALAAEPGQMAQARAALEAAACRAGGEITAGAGQRK